ncbi:MAG: TrkA family potassium uptake protein [Clostridiales bacterium]|nr:TrkA family potassium uptake protein [Clostridiales bacterium]
MQIIVLGASRAGLALVKRLIEKDHDVVLVDPDASTAVEKYKLNVVYVDGVIIDLDVLREAGIEMADAICAVSENENQNLMASQIAREMFDIKRVITRVFDTDDYRLFDGGGFVTISSPELTVEAFIRELGELVAEKKVGFCEQNVLGHAISFNLIEPSEDLVGSKIRDLEDTDGRHVFGVIRHERLQLAVPGMRVEKGDKLILATQKSG